MLADRRSWAIPQFQLFTSCARRLFSRSLVQFFGRWQVEATVSALRAFAVKRAPVAPVRVARGEARPPAKRDTVGDHQRYLETMATTDAQGLNI